MTRHLTDIQLFELANDLIEDAHQKNELMQHISACENCSIQLAQEKALDELLISKLMVEHMVDVSENVTQHFNLKEFANAPDTKWVLYAILVLVIALLGMELLDGKVINLNQTLNNNYIHYMRIILSATTALLFVDVLIKFVKYRKQVL